MELKRALAVRMWIEGIETKKIQDILADIPQVGRELKMCR
jgi:hypothetical protein